MPELICTVRIIKCYSIGMMSMLENYLSFFDRSFSGLNIERPFRTIDLSWNLQTGLDDIFKCAFVIRLRVVGFCSWNPPRAELIKIMQIRERNEEGMGRDRKKTDSFFFLFLRARASRGFAARCSLLHSSTLALRNARKTLGKERDCSQSNL